jgi:hypothetical protein
MSLMGRFVEIGYALERRMLSPLLAANQTSVHEITGAQSFTTNGMGSYLRLGLQ